MTQARDGIAYSTCVGSPASPYAVGHRNQQAQGVSIRLLAAKRFVLSLAYMALLLLIVQGLQLLILADVILSWVMRDPEQFPRSLTRRITQPLYAPIHAILDPRKTGGVDLAPLFVLLLLSALSRFLIS